MRRLSFHPFSSIPTPSSVFAVGLRSLGQNGSRLRTKSTPKPQPPRRRRVQRGSFGTLLRESHLSSLYFRPRHFPSRPRGWQIPYSPPATGIALQVERFQVASSSSDGMIRFRSIVCLVWRKPFPLAAFHHVCLPLSNTTDPPTCLLDTCFPIFIFLS